MNKAELIAKVTEKTGIKADKFVKAFIETVSEALAEGDKVQLIGFGTFETRPRASRSVRNPQTGGTIKVPAKMAPAFKAGKALKDKVNK